MKARILVLLVLTAILAASATAQHFITDDAYRQRVQQDFQAKQATLGGGITDFASLGASQAETEALQFLYAYMTLMDATDYSAQYYLDNVRCALATREQMPWGNDVPELLFRHFVLPVRVNNENLDDFRTQCYQELRQRVAGMTMQQAILEVNHWCHEHVTYHPSDARTLSPLMAMRTALARCGEESTYTVAALRAIGIPARQVYTPRWAHTDDNHAWVEAWADGQWHFLGACEPEPVLDLGWFNAPASRALLLHTRAYGHYEGPEEVMLETPYTTEINLTHNYGATARVDVRVLNTRGKPVKDARVDFKIYNYAEFYLAATKYTDDAGRTFLTAGKGDMLVWASKDGRYSFAKVTFGQDEEVTMLLMDNVGTELDTAWTAQDVDIVPPAEHVRMPQVTAAQRSDNDRRLAREDSLRTAYELTMHSEVSAQRMLKDLGSKSALLRKVLVSSRGNHGTIEAFLRKHAAESDRHAALARCEALLGNLREKDWRDVSAEVLDDAYALMHNRPFTVQSYQYLSPRVEDEMLWPQRQQLQNTIAGLGITANATELAAWIKENIRVEAAQRFDGFAMSPMAVLRTHMANARSRDILFVTMARVMGIEARKDAVTGKVQWRETGGPWQDVDFDNAGDQATAPTGRLQLSYRPVPGFSNPKYYTHFTLSRIAEDGTARLLAFDEGSDEQEGATWQNTFTRGIDLDAGRYILVTGTREANGSVLSQITTFDMNVNDTLTLPLCLRQPTDSTPVVIGTLNSESHFLTLQGDDATILSITGRGYFALGVVQPGQEPTNHALRDLAAARRQLEQWGRPVVLLFTSEKDAKRFRAADYGQLPNTVVYGIDRDGSIAQQIVKEMKLNPDGSLPLFVIADTFNRVVFASQGYTIGLGDQLARIAAQAGQ